MPNIPISASVVNDVLVITAGTLRFHAGTTGPVSGSTLQANYPVSFAVDTSGLTVSVTFTSGTPFKDASGNDLTTFQVENGSPVTPLYKSSVSIQDYPFTVGYVSGGPAHTSTQSGTGDIDIMAGTK